VSVGVESLASTTTKLIEYGVKNILIEKPAGLNYDQVEQLAQKSVESSANVFVAYNRRFYASVQSAREIITNDGGVTSFNFEFTEWAHVIEKIPTSLDVKNKWFLANSTHVVDLAFYLGGKPEQICTFATGMIDWHPDASVFCGAGKSVTGALFSYQANWEAPGRWAVEVLTKKHRLIFKPLEKLQIIKINSLAIESMVIDDAFDTLYKPGLYAQTKNFLAGEHADMCLIDEQLNNMKHYYAMSNYKR
jgi:predicted dehydrogenase